MTRRLNSTVEFAQTLKEEQRHKNLTQQDLADLAGVSVRFLGSLENGKESSEFDKVLQVAETLGVRLGFTLPGDEYAIRLRRLMEGKYQSVPLIGKWDVSRTDHRWFANLLPEEPARGALCRSLDVAIGNDVALLERNGADWAGAIRVLPESSDEFSADHDRYEPISHETLTELMAGWIPFRQASEQGLIRLSLAGAQDQWPLRSRSRRHRSCLQCGAKSNPPCSDAPGPVIKSGMQPPVF
ncbi:MAG: helix-turn-helix domain-containing protein [Spirochaetaceae bacterium]|nr:helix-turn-helix domain-containing protein [Spirochaetaceae bacterium]MDT8296884.1 helix-turn-helix domain-containing protein [Spirochaetaceae bacterium]